MFFYFERLALPGVCAPARERLGASGFWLGVFHASEVRPSVLRAPGSGRALGVRLAWLVLPEVGGGFFRASGIFLWGSVTHSFRLDFHQQKEIGERPGRRAILHAAPALSPVLRWHSAPLRPRAPLFLSRDSPCYAGAVLCSPPRPHTCRFAGSDTAFAAIAANAGSAGNPLFPTDLAFGQRQRTRQTPLGEVEEEEVVEEKVGEVGETEERKRRWRWWWWWWCCNGGRREGAQSPLPWSRHADPRKVTPRSLPSLRMPDPWETRCFLRI